MLPVNACDEIIDFFIAGKSPDQVDAFRPSAETNARISGLLDLAKEDRLSADERSELDDYLQLEHLMILAKARARRRSIR